MKTPVTLKGWLAMFASIFVLVGGLISGGWAFMQTNAWAYQLDEVEKYAAQGIKSATCTQLRLQIKILQREKAKDPSSWSATDEVYLQDFIRQWKESCVAAGDSS